MREVTIASPAEVLKLAKRYRAKGALSINMHIGLDMPSEPGRYYPYRTYVPLDMKTLTRMMLTAQEFSDRKVEMGQHAASISYSLSESEFTPKQWHLWINA